MCVQQRRRPAATAASGPPAWPPCAGPQHEGAAGSPLLMQQHRRSRQSSRHARTVRLAHGPHTLNMKWQKKATGCVGAAGAAASCPCAGCIAAAGGHCYRHGRARAGAAHPVAAAAATQRARGSRSVPGATGTPGTAAPVDSRFWITYRIHNFACATPLGAWFANQQSGCTHEALYSAFVPCNS